MREPRRAAGPAEGLGLLGEADEPGAACGAGRRIGGWLGVSRSGLMVNGWLTGVTYDAPALSEMADRAEVLSIRRMVVRID
jgi:hypothetical protein